MAVQRYGFYLRVLIIFLMRVKRTSERCFQHKRIKSLSPSEHVSQAKLNKKQKL